MRQNYEYAAGEAPSPIELASTANQMGEHGWRFVWAVKTGQYSYRMLFEREIDQEGDAIG